MASSFLGAPLSLSSKLPPLDKLNRVCREVDDDFRHISIIKSLRKAKFPVYLIKSKIDKQTYAMKIFEYNQEIPQAYFENETRFSFVNHPNIIRTHHIQHEIKIISKGVQKKASCIIMEYAPYGDFLDFIMNYRQDINDKLIRTYFRHLIEGLEYLHIQGISHLDLKLENLLIGKDFNLKIADFDLSHFTGDLKILGRGTKFYRAPELIYGECQDMKAADIYSAGIILFALKTRGVLPHSEDNCINGIDFAGLLYSHNEKFWDKHCEVLKRDSSFFDEDFKILFNSMVSLDSNKRLSIQQIKQSKWYNGSYYTVEELQEKVEKFVYSKI